MCISLLLIVSEKIRTVMHGLSNRMAVAIACTDAGAVI
jgi:hypothetical protein